ncbi:MAG: hypothetical protein WB810_15710, partial [Candidatus Cybelea sp.]
MDDRIIPQRLLSPLAPPWSAGGPSGHRGQGCGARPVDAGDLDDGLPRGFLVGAIVQVWVA